MSGAAVLSEKAIRIALLFREATILDEVHWRAFAKRAGLPVEKDAREIFTENLSLRTVRDLLMMDLITMKYVPKPGDEIQHALNAPVRIYHNEIVAILKANQPDVARLCHALINQGLMKTEDLERALDKAENDALNVYDVLVADHLITPELLEKAVQGHGRDFSVENRILLSGDILTFNHLITKDDFSRALEARVNNQVPLARILEQYEILSQQELYSALEKGIQLPMVELLAYDVSEELLERFPVEFMRRQLFIPLSLQDRYYEIGTADPFNLALADTITLLTGYRISMIYSPHNDLLSKLNVLFPTQTDASAPLISMPPAAVRRSSRTSAPLVQVPPTVAQRPADASGNVDAAVRVSDVDLSRRSAPTEPYVDNLSTVQLVTQIIESAIASNATDIHIEPQDDGVRVRYRVDGQLHSIMRVPAEMQLSIVSRIKVLATMNVTERRRPQDGRFSFSTRAGTYDFRISTLPSIFGEKVVMRILDSSKMLTGLPQLGLEAEQEATLARMIVRPHGLILVTGPTGSGKTSTLYACLNMCNRENVNIITIENPIEYQIDGLTQVQVDPNIDLTFHSGLRGALRQDPDIIMVGEIRDPETAHIAIRASMTGHLVFSTLHTNTAVGAVSALQHMGINGFLASSALLGVIAQRLVRKVCVNCKRSVTPAKGLLRDLGLSENTRKRFSEGAGCENCFGTGYSGRTAIFEVIEMNDKLRRAITDGATEEILTEIARKASQGLRVSGVHKILEGITTPYEVMKAVALS